MKVLALQHGVTREQVQDNTGFKLLFDEKIEIDRAAAQGASWPCCAHLDPERALHGMAAAAASPIARKTKGTRGQSMTKKRETEFGIAMRNFTKYPEMPSAHELIEYGVRMEELGYESIWAWDHILLGVEPNFPIHEALIILTAIAARTTKIKIGTGILVMPVRNPVLLAKELATIDHVSERPAAPGRGGRLVQARVRLPGHRLHPARQDHGAEPRDHQPALDRGQGDGDYPPYNLRGAVLYPKPVQKPRPPILIGGYVDAVLKRAATKGDGWLTYYYTPS